MPISAPTGPFGYDSNDCSGTFAPGASCLIHYTFSPTALGAANGTSSVQVNGVTTNVALQGTGAGVTVPSPFDLGKAGVGDSAARCGLDSHD